MPISVSATEGDDVRATVTDFGALAFNPDTVTNAQLITYATAQFATLNGAGQAWLMVARAALLFYRKQKQALAQLNARVTALEKKT